jgi:transcriptional regulator with XRE-family HTH domain
MVRYSLINSMHVLKGTGRHMQQDGYIADYIITRREALARRVREARDRAGISQEEVAGFLGCSRARIIEIEKEDSPSEYSAAEIELLAALLGRNSLDILRMSDQEAINLGLIMTEQRTGSALQDLVDCKLPKRILSLFADADDFPGALTFSPGGKLVASIVDSWRGEGLMEDDPPYRLTILCWETRTGKLLGEFRQADVERIIPLDSGRVVMLTYKPFPEHRQTLAHKGTAQLLVWNVYTREVERKIQLPERGQAVAVTPDNHHLAIYFAATTSIQVWQTTDWMPVSAFELLFLADHYSPGDSITTAVDVYELTREQKFARGMQDYDSYRFDFLDDTTLIIGFETGSQVGLDIRPTSRGYAKEPDPLGYPSNQFPSLVHRRTAACEIAVKGLKHEYQVGESCIELHYQVPRKRNQHSWDSSVRVVRRFAGAVHHPVILDEACVLSLVSYDTPYRLGRGFHGYKTRIGILNAMSGRVVMLMDHERFQGGDNQVEANISPNGEAIAYWTLPHEGDMRLTVQWIDHVPLRMKGVTLSEELNLHRKLLRQEQEYARL